MTETAKSTWWKTVLGEYPTGVVLVTTIDAEGNPAGMVVGTFSAISQDPPLVGFFPDQSSSTFPIIEANGRFSVSVLGDAHEGLCRAFARKDPERFATGEWVVGAGGVPRLADALAWFDARLAGTPPVGDHLLALGAVDDFGTGSGDAGLPLLFLRGGYGTFAVPGADLDPGALAEQLRAADKALPIVDSLSREIGKEVFVSAVVRDRVVVVGSSLTAAGVRESRAGINFPFTAPLAPVFAAWANESTVTGWLENSRHLLGAVDRPALNDLLDTVRARGYAISSGHVLADEFEALVTGDGRGRASFARLWHAVADENARARSGVPEDVTSVQIPVIGADGTVRLALVVNGFSDSDDVAAVAARLVSAAAEVSPLLTAS